MKHYSIPIFVPEDGCPHQCVFCDQRKISGSTKSPSSSGVKSTIEKYLSTINAENSHVEVGFFGGNFTGINISLQEKYLALVQPYIENGLIKSIRLSTRPDYIDQDRLDLLKKYNVTTIELGAQSLNEEVLKASGRGHTVDHIIASSKLIKNNGFELGLQMMIGLPKDSKERDMETARKIIELQADCTRIYPTVIIKNTALEKLYNDKIYSPLSFENAINISKDLVLIFESNNINILRVGLHPSEGLLSGNDIVAGPFHQSFKEFVLTEIWNDLFYKHKFNKSNSITISVPNHELNFAIGYYGKNKKMLLNKFKKVTFKIDSKLTNREFNVCYN